MFLILVCWFVGLLVEQVLVLVCFFCCAASLLQCYCPAIVLLCAGVLLCCCASVAVEAMQELCFGLDVADHDNKDTNRGSIRRNFTSVRAAALQASGLAARSMAFKGTDNEPFSIKGDDQSLKQLLRSAEDNGITDIRDSLAFGKEIDEDFPREYNEQKKELKNQNKCRVGSSTVRRLFVDDTLAEIEGLNDYTNNAGGGVDLPKLTNCGNEMARLSYVDSH